MRWMCHLWPRLNFATCKSRLSGHKPCQQTAPHRTILSSLYKGQYFSCCGAAVPTALCPQLLRTPASSSSRTGLQGVHVHVLRPGVVPLVVQAQLEPREARRDLDLLRPVQPGLLVHEGLLGRHLALGVQQVGHARGVVLRAHRVEGAEAHGRAPPGGAQVQREDRRVRAVGRVDVPQRGHVAVRVQRVEEVVRVRVAQVLRGHRVEPLEARAPLHLVGGRRDLPDVHVVLVVRVGRVHPVHVGGGQHVARGQQVGAAVAHGVVARGVAEDLPGLPRGLVHVQDHVARAGAPGLGHLLVPVAHVVVEEAVEPHAQVLELVLVVPGAEAVAPGVLPRGRVLVPLGVGDGEGGVRPAQHPLHLRGRQVDLLQGGRGAQGDVHGVVVHGDVVDVRLVLHEGEELLARGGPGGGHGRGVLLHLAGRLHAEVGLVGGGVPQGVGVRLQGQPLHGGGALPPAPDPRAVVPRGEQHLARRAQVHALGAALERAEGRHGARVVEHQEEGREGVALGVAAVQVHHRVAFLLLKVQEIVLLEALIVEEIQIVFGHTSLHCFLT
mmetsp:Transcript_22022/g.30284  ORF Transcript_22022/g.30284 Transcript_22022/m.30284 type:complete len:553 (-) Transcript_22022:259-1917(-)